MDPELKKIWRNYVRNLEGAVKNHRFQTALKRAIKGYREGMVKIFEKYPEIKQLAKEVRKIKENSIKRNRELLKLAKERFEENGASVYIAKTAEEAREIIYKILDGAKIIVKSKSMVTEEIELRQYLQSKGIEVWETDLGEFIIQLANSKPMHLVTPSLHIPREQVAELFNKLMGKNIDKDDIPAMVRAAREFLRDKYFKADAGISGANVVAAEEGAALIIENEGNAKLSISIPKKHIVVTGIEKIVPNLMDAMKVAMVTWRYAKYDVTSYINIVFGPTGVDLLGGYHRNIYGPRELHVVFVDNGRSSMINNPIFREASYCLRCGACIYECPVFNLFAGYFGGKTYMGGIGTIWSAFTEGIKYAIPAAYTCLLDGRCKVICPLNIDVPRMMLELRKKIVSGVSSLN